MTVPAPTTGFEDRVLGCLVGGLVGDAMGTPTENLEPERIAEVHGWVSDVSGSGTDDSAMRGLLCEALLATDGHAGPDDWAERWLANLGVFRGPLRSRFFISVLHTAERLAAGQDARTVAIGNMASSSSAMCIAPVGIVNAGDPRAASAQAWSLGSLIHVGQVAFCADAAAAIAAAVATAVVPGASLEEVLAGAGATLHPRSGALMRGLIARAIATAREAGGYEAFRRDYHASFRQGVACDSRETVPAVFGLLALAGDDPRRCVEYAANFGRDTDTIGAMVGAVTGALAGAAALPASWMAALDPERLAGERRMASRLAALAITTALRRRDLAASMLDRVRATPQADARRTSS